MKFSGAVELSVVEISDLSCFLMKTLFVFTLLINFVLILLKSPLKNGIKMLWWVSSDRVHSSPPNWPPLCFGH